jgi:hypothetical protein
MIHHHQPRILKLIPRHGLGNRLLAIASAVRLLNRGIFDELHICWQPSTDLITKFSDIIDLRCPHIIVESNDIEGRYINYSNLPKDHRIPAKESITVEAFDVYTDIDDDNTQDIVRLELIEALKQIKFTQNHYNKADLYDVSNCIGLHCRRSDYPFTKQVLSEKATTQYHDRLDQLFMKIIMDDYHNQKLFIASDSQKTTNLFVAKFDNIIHVSKTNYPVWAYRPKLTVDEGIVDMILLSRCKSIVSDSFSTFSLVAAWIGNIERITWIRPNVTT